MKRKRGGGARAGGSGGSAGDARAEGERQALLLATQALGVDAAAARDAREALDVLIDSLFIDHKVSADYVLLLAAYHGKTLLARLALERGACMNAHGCLREWTPWHLREGTTPLCYAAGRGHVDCVKMLLEAGADKDNAKVPGKTPLCCAAYQGHVECVKLLLECGADRTRGDKCGKTPLGLAAEEGHADCLELLLKVGDDKAHVDMRDHMGITPLHEATTGGHTTCVNLLLKAGADKDRVTDQGISALHFAAAYESTDCLKLLLEAGADTSLRDDEGMTPLQVAEDRGSTVWHENETIAVLRAWLSDGTTLG